MRNINNSMEKRKYWLFVTNDENWKTIKNKSIYGFNDRGKKDLKKLSIKDVVIIYIKGKKMGGIFEIKSLKSNIKTRFKEGDYPYKIELKKIMIPNELLELTDNIINQISIFKGIRKWGTILMGRATKEINEKDYYYIRRIMKK